MDFIPDVFSPIHWKGGRLHLIDQLKLPSEETWVECDNEEAVAYAIRNMLVRGAPAIGITAAYGVAIAGRRLATSCTSDDEFKQQMSRVHNLLSQTRPTAVNLFWALNQMTTVILASSSRNEAAVNLEARAIEIHKEDIAMCRRMGELGAELIPDGATVLTHCNAGALATGAWGTALGVIRGARAAGKKITVVADETRPYLQGARLTAWELHNDGFEVAVIPDSAAPFLIARGKITCAVVGADRIAANGDVANKIGTYSVALACHRAGVPFYVAAPTSTVDLDTATGDDIPIEERSGREMMFVGETRIAPEGVTGLYPAFDVTPAELITAIITDRGVLRAPYGPALAALK